MSSDILVAKNSFSTEVNGVPQAVTKGETFREGHPVVEGREELFEPFTIDNDLEQATAAPGEKRHRSKAKKSAATGQEASASQAKDESTQEAEQATAAPGEKSDDSPA
jgi:hypothetical protein